VSSTNLALINSEHLFSQADALLLQTGRGSLRQADLRRTFSNAYYGLFHAILTAAADEAVGRTRRNDPLWTLAYRSISHQRLKTVCNDLQAATLKPKIRRYEPPGGFGGHIVTIAGAVSELQDRRHAADYDPSQSFLQTDARAALQTARSAVNRLAYLEADQRRAFLYLLLFEPR
jgi:uncharacterized protein (UPF0332 family)